MVESCNNITYNTKYETKQKIHYIIDKLNLFVNVLFQKKYISLDNFENPINSQLEIKSYPMEPKYLNIFFEYLQNYKKITDSSLFIPEVKEKEYYEINDS